ncbi:MAG TPA: MFS transporter [Gaiellaceae bacterium]|nr:MFS transporter [Gaiellaceae bacterium]
MGTRYRWVILAAGTLAQASFSALSVGLPALAPALRSHYRLSLGETGVVLGAVGIGMLFTLLPWGFLADRINEQLVIAVGLVLAAGSLVFAGSTTAYGPLVGALVAAGAFGASVNAASGRAVMGWFPADQRGLALGVRQTAIPIGGAAAAAALPWLADAGGTKLAFVVLGCSCLAGAVVALAFIRTPPAAGADLANLRGPMRDLRMWVLGLGAGLYITAQVGITGFLVLFLHEHRGVSAHAAALLLAGINVCSIGSRIASGRWSDRVHTRLRPIRQIGVALTATTALVAVTTDAPLAVLIPALVVAGVLSMSWNGLAIAAAAETASGGRVGAAIGLQQTLLGIVVAAVPPAFAAVAGSSWRLAFALAAAGPAVGALALLVVPEPRTRTGVTLDAAAPSGSSS